MMFGVVAWRKYIKYVITCVSYFKKKLQRFYEKSWAYRSIIIIIIINYHKYYMKDNNLVRPLISLKVLKVL